MPGASERIFAENENILQQAIFQAGVNVAATQTWKVLRDFPGLFQLLPQRFVSDGHSTYAV